MTVTRLAARLRPSVGRPWPHRPPTGGEVAPALEAVARAVAAGRSLSAAVADVAATTPAATRPTRPTRPAHRRGTGPRFGVLLNEAHLRHQRGESLADALAAVVAQAPAGGHETTLGLVVLELAARHGGAPAMSLERSAFSLRQRQAALGERRAQSAQARLSALVLTVLPAGFAAWTLTTDARARAFLLGSPVGWVCLVAGVGANVAGWWWMRRIVGRPT